MSYYRAIAPIGPSEPRLAGQAPLKRYWAIPQPRHSATVSTGLRELLMAVKRLRVRPPHPPGGPQQPPEGLRRQSYWDDPALWMLMLH